MTDPNIPVLLTRDGHVAYVTLNRPESLNAFNDAMRSGFVAVIEELEQDETVRVIVISGAGERAFCAGADVKEVRAATSPIEQRKRLVPRSWIEVLDSVTKPTIAAVSGVCFGGGMEIALACDIRMASEDAKFGLTETMLGLIPGGGGTQRLTRVIGLGPALDMLIAAERISARRAYELGLVTRLANDKAALLQDARSLAESIAQRPPAAIAYAKEAAIQGAENGLQSGLRLEKALFALLTGTDDRREAAAAFKEKRKPNFSGR